MTIGPRLSSIDWLTNHGNALERWLTDWLMTEGCFQGTWDFGENWTKLVQNRKGRNWDFCGATETANAEWTISTSDIGKPTKSKFYSWLLTANVVGRPSEKFLSLFCTWKTEEREKQVLVRQICESRITTFFIMLWCHWLVCAHLCPINLAIAGRD